MVTAQVGLLTHTQISGDALRIWESGVNAVLPQASIARFIRASSDTFYVGEHEESAYQNKSPYLLAFGKAGHSMACAAVAALAPAGCSFRGRILVPEGSYQPLPGLVTHQVRPLGYNYPTEKVIEAAALAFAEVSALGPEDLLLCMISGGGSALFELPVAGVTLSHIVETSQFLAARKASIHELNTVRACLSRVKFGGLARACSAGAIQTLIISDVPGDNLEIIASGPTYDAVHPDPAVALAILGKFGANASDAPPMVKEAAAFIKSRLLHLSSEVPAPPRALHHLIATSATAVDAAIAQAGTRGYPTLILGTDLQGDAYQFGRNLAEECLTRIRSGWRGCLAYGGETTVKVSPVRPPTAKGGRNQAIVLSFMERLQQEADPISRELVFVAGGTDGEDGPTDAAGALFTPELLQNVQSAGISPADFLAANDEYSFFSRFGGLVTTGLTGTNVADLGIVIIA